MKYLVLYFIFCTHVFADIEKAPRSFKHQGKRAVFVDFKYAHYDITYNARMGKAWAISTINFDMPDKGYPLFDSVSRPSYVTVNNKKTKQTLIRTPGEASWMRMIDEELEPGNYTLEIKTPIQKGTFYQRYKAGWARASSGFFIRDLSDRTFVEKYLPTNYEYDQYKMDMDVKVEGTKRWHSLFANGKVTKISENQYHVSMPEWYTASSVYFHLVPINKFVRWYLTYPSIDGRNIPVTIYSKYRFYNHYVKRTAWNVLKELERDYGPYPHDKLIIYGTGIRGGMEHAGATET